MKYGSLFSGIGGFDRGFDLAGFECSWQVEKEPSCIQVLERHWPNTHRYADIESVGSLPWVDVICAGWPCQDLSVAGKRAGLNGARSGLFFEFIRVINETKPSYVVWENVPGLLSANSGRDFATCLSELERVGYCGAWTNLDARWFGVAQRRRRIFGVFALRDIGAGRCAEILSLASRSSRNSPPRREARAKTTACLAGRPYADREAEESRLVASAGPRNGNGHPLNLISVPDVTWALQERDAKGADSDTKDGHLLVMPILEAGARTNGDGYRDGDGIGNPGDPMFTLQSGKQHAVAAPLSAGMSATPGVNRPGRRREDDENLVLDRLEHHRFNCLTCGHWFGVNDYEASIVTCPKCGETHIDKITDTIEDFVLMSSRIAATPNSGGNSGGFRTEPGEHLVASPITAAYAKSASDDLDGLNGHLIITHALSSEGADASEDGTGRGTPGGFGVRRLTPRECERLQGFADDWTAGQSDSARYRMLGNAVAVPVAEWIAKRIAKVAP